MHSLLQKFEMTEPGTDIVESVTLIYESSGDLSRLSEILEPLGHPRCSDAPTPRSAFVEEWTRERDQRFFDGTTTESPVAAFFVFENAKAAKRLEVFVWTLEQVDEDDVEDALVHWAFLLKVIAI